MILIVPDVIRSKIFFHLGHKIKIISTLFHFRVKYRCFTALKYSDVRERVETLIATSLKLRVVVPSPLLILVIYVSSVQWICIHSACYAYEYSKFNNCIFWNKYSQLALYKDHGYCQILSWESIKPKWSFLQEKMARSSLTTNRTPTCRNFLCQRREL